MERTPGSDLAAAKAEDPQLIAELVELPMSELDNPTTEPMSWRGFTPTHALLSTVIDQLVELKVITDALVRAQVTFDGDGPPMGKRHVPRPDTPIELAKKIKNERERLGLDNWYTTLMKGVN